MKSILPILLLTACAAPQIVSQRTIDVDGNPLLIASGTSGAGRLVIVENRDKRWSGKYAGGKEQWDARAALLKDYASREINALCGEWFYQSERGFIYHMMDKDDRMGGAAVAMGITASMLAHLAAASATEPANVPVSVRIEFRCRRDTI